MTSPEVDQELERLFSVTRAATEPDSRARLRIRAGLDARLLAGEGPAASRAAKKHWVGVGVAVVGVGAAALWLSTLPRGAVPSAQAPVVARSTTPRAAASALPVVTPAPPPSEPAVAAAPPPSPRATALAPQRAELARPASASSTPATPDPGEEVGLVRAMQQALRSGDPSRALALAGEHARRFPHGALVEEREGARAVASCQLAEPSARATVGEAFTRRFGASPYAARVKAACR